MRRPLRIALCLAGLLTLPVFGQQQPPPLYPSVQMAGPPAEKVLDRGLAGLRDSGKLGWIDFRADWCKWCVSLEKFFDSSDAAPILRRYYTVIRIDTEKNAGADAISAKLGEKEGEGLPWWAVVDSSGKPLATSTGPKGNVGFPAEEHEIAHFLSVLRSTAKGITPAELTQVEKTLRNSK